MVSEAAKKIKGDVDDTNETIINDISLVHKNIEEYNKVLKNFKKTSKSSEKIIDDTIDILNEVNSKLTNRLIMREMVSTAPSSDKSKNTNIECLFSSYSLCNDW